MKYTYDPMADAVNISFTKGRVARTDEIAPGAILDFDRKGNLLSMEVLDASKRSQGSREIVLEPARYSRKDMSRLAV